MIDSITLFIGKILGPYWLIYGLGFLVSPKFYEKQATNSENTDSVATTLQGVIHFYVGMLILLNHFLWDNVLAIMVTGLGFMYLLKGVALIVIPKITLKSGKASIKTIRISGISFVLVGLVLGYLSYFAG